MCERSTATSCQLAEAQVLYYPIVTRPPHRIHARRVAFRPLGRHPNEATPKTLDRHPHVDSGFFQPLDFFGDGPRIPFLAISKFSQGGKVSHTYADHASVVKFIERNWHLKPLTGRSRDNLPNPNVGANPYVPTNMPAISDLFDLFDFSGGQDRSG